MTDESQFLEMIQTSDDVASRLVYADWLDERGDPRGELIRIEEEMRGLPIFSNQYWQLKRRRNELRSETLKDWLEQMRYGVDCQPIFTHGIPEDWKGRWRLIREFVERWHNHSLGDVGGRSREIQEAENRLGRTLPPSVREWVAFAFDVPSEEDYHNVISGARYEMEDVEGHSAVSLLYQFEDDCYHWAVRHQDFHIADPPVHGFEWNFQENEDDELYASDAQNPIHDSLTAFVLEYVIGCAFGKGGHLDVWVSDGKKLIQDLKSAFPVQTQFGQMMIFETDNILARFTSLSSGRLHVDVAKPISDPEIPAFLWDYARSGYNGRYGIFATPPPQPIADTRALLQKSDPPKNSDQPLQAATKPSLGRDKENPTSDENDVLVKLMAAIFWGSPGIATLAYGFLFVETDAKYIFYLFGALSLFPLIGLLNE